MSALCTALLVLAAATLSSPMLNPSVDDASGIEESGDYATVVYSSSQAVELYDFTQSLSMEVEPSMTVELSATEDLHLIAELTTALPDAGYTTASTVSSPLYSSIDTSGSGDLDDVSSLLSNTPGDSDFLTPTPLIVPTTHTVIQATPSPNLTSSGDNIPSTDLSVITSSASVFTNITNLSSSTVLSAVISVAFTSVDLVISSTVSPSTSSNSPSDDVSTVVSSMITLESSGDNISSTMSSLLLEITPLSSDDDIMIINTESLNIPLPMSSEISQLPGTVLPSSSATPTTGQPDGVVIPRLAIVGIIIVGLILGLSVLTLILSTICFIGKQCRKKRSSYNVFQVEQAQINTQRKKAKVHVVEQQPVLIRKKPVYLREMTESIVIENLAYSNMNEDIDDLSSVAHRDSALDNSGDQQEDGHNSETIQQENGVTAQVTIEESARSQATPHQPVTV